MILNIHLFDDKTLSSAFGLGETVNQGQQAWDNILTVSQEALK